jgi:hypothetical protein
MSEQTYPPGHLSFIRTDFVRPLTVFLPTVYRYLPRQFADAFHAKGEIRISCFEAFKHHTDEQQQDSQEGHSFNVISDQKSNLTFATYTVAGMNAYILSLTSISSPNLSAAFGDSKIEIFEPMGFAAEVANEIPGCKGVLIGPCIYADNKMLLGKGKAPGLEDLRSDAEPDKIDLGKMMAHSAQMEGPKAYFLKTRKYEAQNEYRIIWETNRPVSEPLLIAQPALRKYCRDGTSEE